MIISKESMEKISHMHHILPSQSFSIHSLADGSEVISETEEIKAIKQFRDRALREIASKNYSLALQFLNDAIEIDDKSQDLLKIRAQVLLDINNINDALTDIERLSALNPESPEVKTLEGRLLEKSGKFEEAVVSHLKCLDMASVAEQIEIRDRLVELFKNIIDLDDTLMQNLTDCDLSVCLVELGLLAEQHQRPTLSIHLLTCVQPFIGTQRGLRMRSLLALAHSHGVTGAVDRSLEAYQDCLAAANEADDLRYQVKALVSLASLFHNRQEYHQAVIHYERLLDLKAACETKQLSRENTLLSLPGCQTDEKTSVDGNDPGQTIWPLSLEMALRANLSLAYKNIGDLARASEHAKENIRLIESAKTDNISVEANNEADAHWLAGELAEALGDITSAAEHFKANIAAAKRAGDQMGRARGYGRLGAVYAALKHGKLSETFHVQHVLTMEHPTNSDPQSIGNAWKLMGESMMRLERFDEADECFVEFLKYAMKGRDVGERVLALLKMGEAYKAAGRHQHALFYFQEAEMYAEEETSGSGDGNFESNNEQILADIQMSMANILSHSNFVMELQTAKNYLDKLIPALESQIQQHREQNTFCPEELIQRLDSSLRCLQKVLLKSGNREEALSVADRTRKWSWYRHLAHQAAVISPFATPNPLSRSLQSLVSGSQLMRLGDSHATFDSVKALEAVRQQEALVLYYSVLDDTLVIWVLKPGALKVPPPPVKSTKKRHPNQMRQQKSQIQQQTYECTARLSSSVTDWRGRLPVKQLLRFCDNRALPLKDEPLIRIKRENESKQLPGSHALSSGSSPISSMSSRESAPPEQVLYELLIEPVKEVMTKFAAEYAAKPNCVDAQPALIIVPDRFLGLCPFHALCSRDGLVLGDEWRVTVVPSLFTLSRVLVNELDQLEIVQSIERQREDTKHGGPLRNRLPPPPPASPLREEASNYSGIDTKKITNPYLVYGDRSEVKLHENVKRTGYSTLTAKSNPKQQKSKDMKLPPLKQTNVPSPRIQQSLSGITTMTCTGTDICRSSLAVPDYRQVADLDRCLVIGNPKVPDSVSLNGRKWRPCASLSHTRDELREVGSYCAVDPVDGCEATKDRFFELAPYASLLHIATWGCCHEGTLVFTPNSWRQDSSVVEESSFLVRPPELLRIRLRANLVVLSCAWSNQRREVADMNNLLPSLFLLAGAQCVLMQLWAVPREVQHKFYYHFYQSLQEGATVTEAHAVATKALKSTPSYSDSIYWSPFTLFGKDVYIDLNFTRHAQLDHRLDAVMRECSGPAPAPDPLNLPTRPCKDKAKEKEKQKEEIQTHIKHILQVHQQNPGAMESLSSLLDASTRSQTPLEQTHMLNSKLTAASAKLFRKLLLFLGFQIQPRGPYSPDNEPFVLLPGMSALVQSAAEGVRACVELKENAPVAEALINYLPAQQESLSFMIDLLSITKHANDLQLKVSDLSVKYLWQDTISRSVLSSLGYIQIGPLLHFNRTAPNSILLRCCLQLLLSFSTNKSLTLLHRLDINLLGTQNNPSPDNPDTTTLRSLEPRMDQNGEVIITRPWLTTVERNPEIAAKLRLAGTVEETKRRSKTEIERNKSWILSNLKPQIQVAETTYHRAADLGTKVKLNQNGTPEAEIPILKVTETEKLRSLSHNFVESRISNVQKKYADETQRNFIHYCK